MWAVPCQATQAGQAWATHRDPHPVTLTSTSHSIIVEHDIQAGFNALPSKDLCTTVMSAKAGIQGGGVLGWMVSFPIPYVSSSSELCKGPIEGEEMSLLPLLEKARMRG